MGRSRASLRRAKSKLEAGASAAKTVWASGLAVSSSTVTAHEEGSDGGLEELLKALDGTHANDADAEVPKRWVDYCGGDEDKARKRWRAMAQYRESHAMTDILDREQKEFFRIKKLYPQFWLGQDAEGNLVTLELLRDTRKIVSVLRHAGVSSERFARHQSFLTEYWIHQGLSRTGQIVRIIDVEDTPIFAQALGSVRQYFGATSIAMYHYPGLTAKIYFVNVSRAFRLAWLLMANFLDERTRESVHLLGSPMELPEDLLPDTFTGELTRELEHVGIESNLSKFVRHVNAQHAGPSSVVASDGDDHEPAVIYGKEAFYAALPGNWNVIGIESESLDPVLRAAGVSYFNRTAISMLTPSETVALEDGRASVTTWVGPMSKTLRGLVDGGEAGDSDSDDEDEKKPAKDPQVRVDLVPRPTFLIDSACSPCLRFTCKFANGDVMTMHHGVHRFSKDKKVTNIRYKARYGEKPRSCLLVLRKASA